MSAQPAGNFRQTRKSCLTAPEDPTDFPLQFCCQRRGFDRMPFDPLTDNERENYVHTGRLSEPPWRRFIISGLPIRGLTRIRPEKKCHREGKAVNEHPDNSSSIDQRWLSPPVGAPSNSPNPRPRTAVRLGIQTESQTRRASKPASFCFQDKGVVAQIRPCFSGCPQSTE